MLEATTLSADEAEFAGEWALKSLEIPARLREVYFREANTTTRTSENSSDFAKDGERLVDVFFPDPFGSETGNLTLDTDGAISGFTNGTFIAGADNRWTAAVDGPDTVRGYSNLSKDFLIAPGGSVDFAEFQVLSKIPPALSIADLSGTWKIATLAVPADLILHFFNSVNLTSRDAGSDSSPGQDEALVDTYFEEPIATQNLTLVADANGDITGDLDGSIFTVKTDPNRVTLSIPGDTPIDLTINANKDVMAQALADDPGGGVVSHEMILAVKLPSTLTLAEAQGIWRWQALSVPKSLKEVYFNSITQSTRTSLDSTDFAGDDEQLVDLYFPDQPNSQNGLVSIDASGMVEGTDKGALTLNGLSYTYTPADPNDTPVTLYPNATGDVIIGTGFDDDELDLFVMVKIRNEPASDFNDLVNLKVVLSNGSVSLQWNEATNFCLSASSGLSQWDPICNTQGADSHTDPAINESQFYRVERVTDQ